MRFVSSRFGLMAVASFSLPALGHHSPAMFDLGKEIRLEGVVREVSWRNPHVYIGVEVASPGGETRLQQIEAGPASNLATIGVDARTLLAGDRVVVEARPNRAGPDKTALGWLLTKADGTTIPLHVRAMAQPGPVVAEATSIAGVWVPQAPAFAALTVTAREWPLTDAGRAAIAATAEARVAAREQCVPYGPPALMALPAATTVTVGASEVRFRLDTMNVERVVHLTQAGHPAGLTPSALGHSIGRWEGNTLVVDTVGYAAHPEGYAFDLPSSAAKHIVERFALSADRRHIDYEAVVEDPEYFAAPVTHRSQWDYRPEQQPSGLPCDLESARRFATE